MRRSPPRDRSGDPPSVSYFALRTAENSPPRAALDHVPHLRHRYRCFLPAPVYAYPRRSSASGPAGQFGQPSMASVYRLALIPVSDGSRSLYIFGRSRTSWMQYRSMRSRARCRARSSPRTSARYISSHRSRAFSSFLPSNPSRCVDVNCNLLDRLRKFFRICNMRSTFTTGLYGLPPRTPSRLNSALIHGRSNLFELYPMTWVAWSSRSHRSSYAPGSSAHEALVVARGSPYQWDAHMSISGFRSTCFKPKFWLNIP